MPSAFSIRMPSVLASLPRPIDSVTGRYVVSEVHGGTAGSRKRKRGELAVGIDGEGLNIYGIQSSKLVTSYALPPQTSFTCPPCSVRLRKSKKSGVERRTYVSTKDTVSRITLFRDSTTAEGLTTSSVITRKLVGSKDAIFMTITPDSVRTDQDQLLLVRRDGEIQCMDGHNLEVRWSCVPTEISKYATVPYMLDFIVEFAQITDAYSARNGILKDREDTLTGFSQEINPQSYNPTVLIVITAPSQPALQSARTVHVLSLPEVTDPASYGKIHSVHTLTTLSLPWGHKDSPAKVGPIEYNLQAPSGIIYELAGGHLTTFDLTGSVVQIKSKLSIEGKSFIPLSNTSIITSSNDKLSIYHPVFRSIQASIDLTSELNSDIRSKKRLLNGDAKETAHACRLVAFSAKQSVVFAIAGTDLLSFQLEARQDDTGRPRSLGLLIDSIGCGALNSESKKPGTLKPLKMNSLGQYIPGSTDDGNVAIKCAQLDDLVEAGNVEAFEKQMAKLVGLTKIKPSKPNRAANISNEKKLADWNSISWIWPKKRSEYPQYDSIWPQYAISRIFFWSNDIPREQMDESITAKENRLNVAFFPPNVMYWLIQTGNLNKASLTSALQSELKTSGDLEIPDGQIMKCLVEVDPEMNLLLSLLACTYLDAAELLFAIRLLMDSLGIFGDQTEKIMLTNGNRSRFKNGENLDAEVQFEEDQADADLQLAEYRLGDGCSVRHQALSLAFAKLYTCPAAATVKALQSTLKLSEIVSLIYLLRFELAGGSWTSRYLDFYNMTDEYGPPDSAITLISMLLSRCIDAIGAGGWLSGDAMLVSSDHFESEELITSLKLEVSAALEGVEEATYLRGLTAEMLKFAEATSKANSATSQKRTKNDDMKPMVQERAESESALPVGLKAEQQISLHKLGAGGEVYTRSMRDIGQLKSRKVGKYERERIVLTQRPPWISAAMTSDGFNLTAA